MRGLGGFGERLELFYEERLLLKMRLKSFLKLVEIQTKVASVTPLILGCSFAYYRYGVFNWRNFLLMLISLLSFDMATTAINNYIDFKKAIKIYGYGYNEHNAIVRDSMHEFHVLLVIVILLLIAVLFGILLYLNTSLLLLLIGILSFSVGIFYTFGPIPISRMPLGEIFSGFFMGLILTFLSVYIHIVNLGLFSLVVENGVLNIRLNLHELLIIFLVSLPATFGVANIMLANNICDMDDDFQNSRYTLPIYIGKRKALVLFEILYYIAYIDIIILIALKLIPTFTVIMLITIIPVKSNINKFKELQSKKDTFVVGIKNFLAINIPLIIGLILTILLK